MAGLAHAGGGVFTMDGGDTTLDNVAIWSNRIRLDDPDDLTDFGIGGGGLLIRGGSILCRADRDFIGPDLQQDAPVIASNRSERHLVGGVMLMDEDEFRYSDFRSEGCRFGADDLANQTVPLATGFSGLYYDPGGLDTVIECTREACTCDGVPCPAYV